MKKLLGPYSDFFFFLLRVVAALMFLAHGLQKFNVQMLGGFTPPPSIPQLTWAAWIESIGAPLILLGLGTRYVAFILSGEMAVAYFMSHFGTVMVPSTLRRDRDRIASSRISTAARSQSFTASCGCILPREVLENSASTRRWDSISTYVVSAFRHVRSVRL